MFKARAWLVLALWQLLSAPVATAATSAEILRGLSWLSAQPKTDGSVASEALSIGAVVQARAESFRLLQSRAQLLPGAVDALLESAEDNTEFTSRKAIVAGISGRDAAGLIALLAARQNTDGGLGPAAGYQSSALDTAWALLAWRAAGNADAGVIARALQYLGGHANADGGFGLHAQSSVFDTSYVVLALQAHSMRFGISPALAPASSWLAAHQTQGSYGNVVDNAAAALALAAASTDATLYSGAITALRQSQSADGSWGEDAYATALALSALVAVDGVAVPGSGGAISGTLVDAKTAAALGNAQITSAGPQSITAFSGLSGTFLLQGLSPGDYTLQVSLQGYAGAAIQVSVASGATSSVGTIALQPTATTATLRGQLRDGTTGLPLSGARVTLSSGQAAFTDGGGSYQIEGLPPGSVSIIASKTGFDDAIGSGSLTAGTVLVFSPALYPTGKSPDDVSAQGTVADSATHGPLAGATVRIGTITTTTGASGHFIVTGLQSGAATLQLSAPGYQSAGFSTTLVKGVNDFGTIVLAGIPATLTVAGRITDSATNLPLAGASVLVVGTGLRAISDPGGVYAVAGVDASQFTLSISAPGYLRKTLNVSLPQLGDTTVDVALDAAHSPLGLSIRSVTTDRPNYDPFSTIEVEVGIANAGAQDIALQFSAVVLDPQGAPVITLPARSSSLLPAGHETEVELELSTGSQPAGQYSIEVRGYDDAGTLQVEGSASFVMNPLRRLAGAISLDPPIAQAGTNQPVNIKVKLVNHGNLEIPAGSAELVVTVDQPDTQGSLPAQAVAQTLLSGTPLTSLASVTSDMQGNLYALNQRERTILKITPDRQVATILTLPAQLSNPGLAISPTNLARDADGNLYVLNATSEILKYSPSGVLTRIPTGLTAQHALDLDANGNIYVTNGASNIYTLARVSPSGAVSTLLRNGLSNPIGITIGADGAAYVANSADGTIAKVTADGRVLPFVSGLGRPSGITTDGAGDFYVTETDTNSVLKITPAGVKSVYATGFSNPYDLRFDSHGALFVSNAANSSIVKVLPGGIVVPFASSVVTGAQGMRYDHAGNLYAVGGSQVVRLDPQDNVSVLASIFDGDCVAIAPTGEVYLTRFNSGQVVKLGVNGSSTTVATGLGGPAGLTFDDGGVLYVMEQARNRISAVDPAGQIRTIADSLVSSPQYLAVEPSGQLLVLNSNYLAQVNGGGQGTIVSRSVLSMQAVTQAPDGTIYVQDATSIRKLDTAGNTVVVKSGFASLAAGITADGMGNLYLADSAARQLKRLDPAGNIVAIATFNTSPLSFIADGAGSFYVVLNDNRVVKVDTSGTVSAPLAQLSGSWRLAYDASGKLYILTSAGISVVDLATGSVKPLVGRTGLFAIAALSDGTVVAARNDTNELLYYSAQGTQVSSIAGFAHPNDLVWSGSELIFNTDSRFYAMAPNQYPRIIGNGAATFIDWRNGVLYASTRDGISTLGAAGTLVPFASQPNFSSLTGVAVRPDGAVSGVSISNGRLLTFSPNGQVIASYVNLNQIAGLAVDPHDNLFVSNQSGQQLYRFDPSGKQAYLIVSGTGNNGLAFDPAGVLYSSGVDSVYRVDVAAGTRKLVARIPGGSGQLSGIAVTGDTVLATDTLYGMVRAASDAAMVPYASGLSDPRGVAVGPDGAAYVANSNSGVVTKVSAAGAAIYAGGLDHPRSVAFDTTGTLYVGGGSGSLDTVDASGKVAAVGNILGVLIGVPIDALTVPGGAGGPNPVLARDATNELVRVFQTSPAPVPQPGTVVYTATVGTPDLPLDQATGLLDLGTWIPPYGGDFKFTVQPSASGVDGQAVNTLHVGPAALGQMTASRGTLPPGDSSLQLTIKLQGADFRSVAKPDTANVTVTHFNGAVVPSSIGMDASGNLYFYAGNQIRRVAPGSQPVVIFTAPQNITSLSLVPVDNSQGVYYVLSQTLFRVDRDGTNAAIATLPEQILQLALDSQDNVIAVSFNRLYRIKRDGSVSIIGAVGLGISGQMTIDGRDNIYILNAANIVNRIGPDGIASTILSDPTVAFEFEGRNIAGDCADDIFLTPLNWPALGQAGEEHTIVEIVGSTGKAAQVMDGRTISQELGDADFMYFDRYSSSLMLFGDNSSNLYRLPISCGAISTEVHVVFPARQPASGFSVAPSATLARTDGGTEYVWNLKDVSASGRTLSLDTTLPGLRLGQQRAVAQEAFLVFQNSFVAGQVTTPLRIPLVGVDAQLDMTVSTDKPAYGPNEAVVSDVALSNRDSQARVGRLTTDILDEHGRSLARVADQVLSVGSGAPAAVVAPFLTGATPQGRYTVLGTFADAQTGAEVARATSSFLIAGADAGGSQASARITTDKTIYRPSEPAQLRARIINLQENDALAGLTVVTRVLSADGGVRFQHVEALAELAPAAGKDYAYTFGLAFVPAGIYRSTVSVIGTAGNELTSASTQFEVLSTSDTGSGLVGTLAVLPRQVVVGESVVFDVNAANQGNAALHGVPLRLRVIDPTTQQILVELAYSVDLDVGATFQTATSWPNTGRAGVTYVAALFATIGSNTLLLAQEALTVIARPVSLDVQHASPRQARVLALVSCQTDGARSSHSSDQRESCDERSQEEDDACAAQRATALRTYFEALHVDSLVTTSADEFQHELRCGRYNTYWLSGGAFKLSDTLVKEVREAVNRGDALMLEGLHDQRNGLLDEVVGVSYLGQLSKSNLTVTLGDPLFPQQELATNGVALKLGAAGAIVQARFKTTGKEPALLSNLYGQGRAFVAAFEVAETLRRQPSSQPWRDVAATVLGYLASSPPAVLVEGAVVPIETQIVNQGQAANLDIRVTLPAGTSVLVSEPEAFVSSTEALWHAALSSAQTQRFDLNLRLPYVGGTLSLPARVDVVTGAQSQPFATYPLELEVRPLSQLFDDARDALAHVVPKPSAEKDKVARSRKEIDDAQDALNNNDHEHAVEELVDSLDDLRQVTSMSTSVSRLAIDRLLQAMELRWCRAQCFPDTPRAADGKDFSRYGMYERFEMRAGRKGAADWELSLGTDNQQAVKSVQQSLDWVSGKTYKWTLSYDGKGKGSYTVSDGSKQLIKRDYTGSAGALHTGNALLFDVKSAAGLGSAHMEVSVASINGKGIHLSLGTAGNNKASEAFAYYFYPAMQSGFSLSGSVKLTFSASTPPQGSALDFTVTSGNVSCRQ